jgi:hypothetical protein
MKYNKKQKESIKIIDKLVKKNNGKCKGGAGALFTQGKNLLENFDKGNPIQVAQQMMSLLINFKNFLNDKENKNFRNALLSLPYAFSVLKKDNTDDKKNGGDSTNSTSTENNANKKSDEKKCENQENKTYDKQSLNYEELKKKYEEIMNQPDEKKWFSVNLFKKDKFKLEKLYEKNDINEILIELNKIDMHDLPIEIASTLIFIKTEIDRIIDVEEKKQNEEIKKGNVQHDPEQNIGHLKLIVKGFKTGCPFVKMSAKALSFGMKTAIKSQLNTNISMDEADLFRPEIFCSLLDLLDKINIDKYKKSMPSGKKGLIKKLVFDTIINDFNKGVTVIDECGLFPADKETVENYKKKIAFLGKEILTSSGKESLDNNLQQFSNGPLANNALMNNPALMNNALLSNPALLRNPALMKNALMVNAIVRDPLFENLRSKFGSQGAIIDEIFSYVKDVAEILCDYGIDLEIILYNANRSGINTGIYLEIFFKGIAEEIESVVKGFGFSVEEATGFSVREVVKKIFERIYGDGIYNCSHRYTKYRDIKKHTKTDPLGIQHNPNNQIRKIIHEVFASAGSDAFGDIKIGGTRKKKMRTSKTRKRYKR